MSSEWLRRPCKSGALTWYVGTEISVSLSQVMSRIFWCTAGFSAGNIWDSHVQTGKGTWAMMRTACLPQTPSMLYAQVTLRSPRLVSWGTPSVCWRTGSLLTITPDSVQGFVAGPDVNRTSCLGTQQGWDSHGFYKPSLCKRPTFCPYPSQAAASFFTLRMIFAHTLVELIPVVMISSRGTPACLPLTHVHVLPSSPQTSFTAKPLVRKACQWLPGFMLFVWPQPQWTGFCNSGCTVALWETSQTPMLRLYPNTINSALCFLKHFKKQLQSCSNFQKTVQRGPMYILLSFPPW